MATKSAPFYWLTCDHQGCGDKSTENDEFSAYGDVAQALEAAWNSDWRRVETPEGTSDYCAEHANQHCCGECDEPNGEGAQDREWMCSTCWAESEAELSTADPVYDGATLPVS